MKAAIEGFLCILFIAIGVLLGVEIIYSQMQFNSAKQFQANVSKTVADSNFDSTVINDCASKAVEKGYTLTVTVDDTSSKKRCKDCNTLMDGTKSECPNCHSKRLTDRSENKSGVVQLDYTVRLPLLNITRDGSVKSNVK